MNGYFGGFERSKNMICKVCNKDFFSMEWYKAETDLVLCDDCVLYIYKARKDIKQNELNRLDKKIKELELKIVNSK